MILAIDLSSRRGSIALHDGTRVVAGREWDDAAARHLSLWTALPDLVRETGLRWPTLRAIAAGRGPGSYSGLRAALTAAQSLATPDRIPVMAISSGRVLAEAWLREQPDDRPLIVAGDARRGSIWHAQFRLHGHEVRQESDWVLARAADFADSLAPRARVITSDRARLINALGRDAAARIEIANEVHPRADEVARAAWYNLERHAPGEPLEPLYLHPPVTT